LQLVVWCDSGLVGAFARQVFASSSDTRVIA